MLFATRKLKELELEIITQAPTGTISITENGTVDVANYASAEVDVPGITPTGTISITENGTVDVTDYASASVNVPEPTGTITITENGTVDVTDYASAAVNVDYATVNFNLPVFTQAGESYLSDYRTWTANAKTKIYDEDDGHLIFAGGQKAGNARSDKADAYDRDLLRTNAPQLTSGLNRLAGAGVDAYALFGGGVSYSGSSSIVSNAITIYDYNLTSMTNLNLNSAVERLAGASSKQYAIFAGGVNGNSANRAVTVFDNVLSKTSWGMLSVGRSALAGSAIYYDYGNAMAQYYFFAGGTAGSNQSGTVDVYDELGTKLTNPSELSKGRANIVAASIGRSVMFAGGFYSESGTNVFSSAVDVYDNTLTRTTPTGLPFGVGMPGAATVKMGEYAVIGGGDLGSTQSKAVCAYDRTLTRSLLPELKIGKSCPGGGSIGDYVLIAGGYSANGITNHIDVYSTKHNIQVFPGTIYNFNNSGEIYATSWKTIGVEGEVSGYMKVHNAEVTG